MRYLVEDKEAKINVKDKHEVSNVNHLTFRGCMHNISSTTNCAHTEDSDYARKVTYGFVVVIYHTLELHQCIFS